MRDLRLRLLGVLVFAGGFVPALLAVLDPYGRGPAGLFFAPLTALLGTLLAAWLVDGKAAKERVGIVLAVFFVVGASVGLLFPHEDEEGIERAEALRRGRLASVHRMWTDIASVLRTTVRPWASIALLAVAATLLLAKPNLSPVAIEPELYTRAQRERYVPQLPSEVEERALEFQGGYRLAGHGLGVIALFCALLPAGGAERKRRRVRSRGGPATGGASGGDPEAGVAGHSR